MSNGRLKVLLVIEQCNPDLPSVPLVGYRFYQEISQLADVTLVTHGRNEPALAKHASNVTYIYESQFSKRYYRFVASFTAKGKINWPLLNALTYPIYAEFNHQVYRRFSKQIEAGAWDVVHALTPMMPRYPVKLVKACRHTPFLLGPVNGGVPFPAGFQEVAKAEYAQFNFLRAIGRALIPGYIETYRKADKVLAGSTYTLELLKKLFDIPDHRIALFYENGIPQSFFEERTQHNGTIHLLFVGRLVPYKGCDMLLEAYGQLPEKVRAQTQLTIVGDGSERSALEQQAQELGLEDCFAGWVAQEETRQYYRRADIFCFPSVREFGGAVVLEAMACALPCIVINNGGIGEYVTEETGFKIDPVSKDYVVEQLVQTISTLVEDSQLRQTMSVKAVERARHFEWGQKAQQIVEIYHELRR